MKTHLFQVGDRQIRAEVVALDKDGLLFDHHALILELNRERMAAMMTTYNDDPAFLIRWMRKSGIIAHIGLDGKPVADRCLPEGTAVLASTDDEVVTSAAIFMEELGLSWPDARTMALDVHTAADRSIHWWDVIVPRKGCPGIFKRLREKEIPYGIVTMDTADRVRQMVDHVDDASKLSFVFSSSEITNCKPHPEAILKVAEKLGIKPNRILMIGDLPVDMEMAHAAGAQCIGIPEGEYFAEELRVKADFFCGSLDEVLILE